MALVSTFGPQGSLFKVVNAAVQITSQAASGNCNAYRVLNLAAVEQYFTWGATSAVTSIGAPSAGTPSANTIGMLGNSVESFTLPPNIWMIASSATGFEVSTGEGV